PRGPRRAAYGVSRMSRPSKIDKAAVMVFFSIVGAVLVSVVFDTALIWGLLLTGLVGLSGEHRGSNALKEAIFILAFFVLPAVPGAYAGFRLARWLIRRDERRASA